MIAARLREVLCRASDLNVANIRVLLDYCGLMSPEAFAEALRDRSLAG